MCPAVPTSSLLQFYFHCGKQVNELLWMCQLKTPLRHVTWNGPVASADQFSGDSVHSELLGNCSRFHQCHWHGATMSNRSEQASWKRRYVCKYQTHNQRRLLGIHQWKTPISFYLVRLIQCWTGLNNWEMPQNWLLFSQQLGNVK